MSSGSRLQSPPGKLNSNSVVIEERRELSTWGAFLVCLIRWQKSETLSFPRGGNKIIC